MCGGNSTEGSNPSLSASLYQLIRSTSAAEARQELVHHRVLRSFRDDDVVLEIAGAVGLRPQADAPGQRRPQDRVLLRVEVGGGRRTVASRPGSAPQRVLQGQLAVEGRLERRTLDAQAQLVPARAVE